MCLKHGRLRAKQLDTCSRQIANVESLSDAIGTILVHRVRWECERLDLL